MNPRVHPTGHPRVLCRAPRPSHCLGSLATLEKARGANSFMGKTRVSPVGDAYELASSFGSDFSELLVTGANPFRTKLPSIPTMQRVKSLFGGAPKESVCDAFGRVGVTDLLAAQFGLPPGWTDKGAQADITPPCPNRANGTLVAISG